MSSDDPQTTVPRLALTPSEAAASIGVPVTAFEKHVLPDLKLVDLGESQVVPVTEIERWLANRTATQAFAQAWRKDPDAFRVRNI